MSCVSFCFSLTFSGLTLLVPPAGEEAGFDVDEVTLRVLNELIDDRVDHVVHPATARRGQNEPEKVEASTLSKELVKAYSLKKYWSTVTSHPVSSWVWGTRWTLIFPSIGPSTSLGVS